VTEETIIGENWTNLTGKIDLIARFSVNFDSENEAVTSETKLQQHMHLEILSLVRQGAGGARPRPMSF